jgi:hypothetical protein
MESNEIEVAEGPISHIQINLERKIKDSDSLSNDLHKRKMRAVNYYITAESKI